MEIKIGDVVAWHEDPNWLGEVMAVSEYSAQVKWEQTGEMIWQNKEDLRI